MHKIVIFDLETTGLDRTKDEIIQISALKVDHDTMTVLGEFNQYVQPSMAPYPYQISLPAYLKHHIHPDFLKDKPFFKEVAPKVLEFFEDADILTYNGNSFDIPFLKAELNRYGFDIDFMKLNCYDAFLEEKRRNGISLENSYKRYKGKTMSEAGLAAHDALSDVKATYTVFCAQQKILGYGPEKMYGEDNVITDMDFNGEMKPCFNIGKYRCISVEYVAQKDQAYLKWCVEKSNFSNSTKKYLNQFIR